MPFWLDISKIPSYFYCLDISKKNKKSTSLLVAFIELLLTLRFDFTSILLEVYTLAQELKKLISKWQHNYLEINCEKTVYF